MNLDELERIARDATPGKRAWRWKSGQLCVVGEERPYGESILAPTYDYDSGVGMDCKDGDADFIAAFGAGIVVYVEAKEVPEPKERLCIVICRLWLEWKGQT